MHVRWACNQRVGKAVTTCADNGRHDISGAVKDYFRDRARNLDHPHVVRVRARSGSRVIWRCWQDGVPCVPKEHGSAARLADEAA